MMKSLSHRLKEVVFKNLRTYKFKEVRCIDIEILDNRPEDYLIIEGEK